MQFFKQAAKVLALPAILAALVTTAAAQGVQTGELTGIVSSSDGLTLPGATVTARSTALQGVRTVVTDENGAYVIRALPPGSYEVTIEMSGLSPKTEKAQVELGRPPAVPDLDSVGAKLRVLGLLAHLRPFQDVCRMLYYLTGMATERSAVLAYNLLHRGTVEMGEHAIAETVIAPIKRQEPGHYAFVNHAMSLSEKGAQGVFEVTD